MQARRKPSHLSFTSYKLGVYNCNCDDWEKLILFEPKLRELPKSPLRQASPARHCSFQLHFTILINTMASTGNMRWTLRGPSGGVDNLEFGPVAQVAELGPNDVRVTMHAASLNYRDIAIAKGSLPATQPTPGTIPGSDGAGVVHSVGSNVTNFKVGDKVLPHMVHPATDDFLPRLDNISAGLGQALNGTLADESVFPADSLVPMPSNMSFTEAATLGCSGLTSWNALFGLRGRQVKAGDYVLVQGSGGVSIAALQFAHAAGATVVATTGKGDDVAARLTKLGAAHVLNYKKDPDWGTTARKLTPHGRGFDHIVDVGGGSATL